LFRIKTKHFSDKVLEVLREEILAALFVFAVGFPEDITSIFSYAFVEWVMMFGCLERWMSGNHDEEYDGSCKQVTALSTVGFIYVQFRRHVVWSSKFGSEISFTISAIGRS